MRTRAARRILHGPFAAVILLAATSLLAGWPILAGAAVDGGSRVLGSGSPGQLPDLKVLSEDETGLGIEFTLPTVNVEDLDVGGEVYQGLAIPGGAEMGDVGAPLIPTFSRMIMIPDRAGVRISVREEEEEVLDGFRLIPLQDEDGSVFSYDPAAYARNDYGDTPLVRVGAPALMRGLRVVPLTFAPVQFNPAEGRLRVVRRLRVDVLFAGEDLTNAGHGKPRSIPASFDRLYRELIVGYDPQQLRIPVEHGSYLIICPNDAQVTSRLQPLLDWRQRQGYKVVLATTAVTGTTKEAIRTYIQNAYNTWSPPPEFVALAADVDGSYSIPCWYFGGGEGDFPYSRLDGTDLISDVHIGRISYTSLAELEVIVAKTVGYESNPFLTDTGWFTRACVVGDASHSGISTIQVMQWIKTRLRQIGYTQIDTIFGGSFVSQMSAALNQGDTFLAYRGYYGFSGWSNSNTYALTNYNKTPFAVISTCGTGSYANGTSNAEAFLRAGTVAQPKGAIGAIGTATLSTHTRYNNCYTMGVYHSSLYEDEFSMGAGHTRGKYELYLNYNLADPTAVEDFCTWNNLMGDPACEIWTAVPTSMTASYPSTVAVGANSFSISVTEADSNPCVGANVCLWKGTEIFVTGTTDDQGFVELPISAATAGTLKLTVTKHNRRPLLVDIPVATQSLFVAYESSTVDDDNAGGSQGNADGQVNPGETIEFGVQLKNFGTDTAVDVTAALTTIDPYVTITSSEASYGSMAPGASASGSGGFAFQVALGCPHNHVVRFGLDATSGSNQWHSLVEVTVISAHLVASAATIYDPINQKLDPGETRGVSIRVRNQGGLAAAGTMGYLSSLDPWIDVLDGSGTYGNIAMGGIGENATDRFSIHADPATYQGHLAVLQLVTVFNNGMTDTTYVTITVGQAAVTDPTGPDHYGYYAFDNADTGYANAPVYNWVELNPTQGGDGTQVTLGDFADGSDKSVTVDLPFPFTYYGQTFTRATICSNGWIAMGSTYLTDYRNWTIPGAGSPQNLIAVFWDELRESNSGNGHVYQKHDAANHVWTVEWSRMPNGYSTSNLETFEAIFYDPAFYSTMTGDGMIVFQYQTVNNIDSVDGYATVGIQNWDQADGVLYSYWNQYPTTAAPLVTGRAIKFVPSSVDPSGVAPGISSVPARFSLSRCQPNPFSTSTAISFSLQTRGHAALLVYDVQGRSVRHLVEGVLDAGPHSETWDGRDDAGKPVSSGLYFYKLQGGGQERVQRLIRIE